MADMLIQQRLEQCKGHAHRTPLSARHRCLSGDLRGWEVDVVQARQVRGAAVVVTFLPRKAPQQAYGSDSENVLLSIRNIANTQGQRGSCKIPVGQAYTRYGYMSYGVNS